MGGFLPCNWGRWPPKFPPAGNDFRRIDFGTTSKGVHLNDSESDSYDK